MLLVVFFIMLAVLFVASIRNPLIGLLAMVASLPIEYFFMGSLPPGVTVGRSVGLCALVGWLVNRRKFGKSHFLSNRSLMIPAVLFVAVTFFSALFAKNMGPAMSQSIRQAMFLLLGIMVGDLITTRRDLQAFCWVTVLAAGVAAGAALMQFGSYQEGSEIVGNIYQTQQGVRFEGLTSNANVLGINLLSGIPFLFCLFFSSRKGIVRMICMALLGMTAFVLVLTVSRSTIYPLVLYIAVTYALHRKMGKPSTAENVMIAVAGLMLCYAVFQSSAYVWERISRPVVDLQSDTSFTARMEILRQGVSIMSISPFIGVGLSNTRQYFMHMAAHDTFSCLLGETGLLGTMCFIAFSIAVIKTQIGLIKRLRLARDPLMQELGVALVGSLCILAVWLPVKVLFFQRLFWLWAGLVVWMDSKLPPLRGGVVYPAVGAPRTGWGARPPAAPPGFQHPGWPQR